MSQQTTRAGLPLCPPDSVGEHATLAIANVARRRTQQAGEGGLVSEFSQVEAQQVPL